MSPKVITVSYDNTDPSVFAVPEGMTNEQAEKLAWVKINEYGLGDHVLEISISRLESL